MSKFEFTSNAKKVKIDFADVGVWTDGIGVYSDDGPYRAFTLIPGRTYKITIEEVKG